MPTNHAAVLDNIEHKRYKEQDMYAKAFEKLNQTFSVNDMVRIKTPKTPFSKEGQVFSDEIYVVVDIVYTEPVRSYKLKELNSEVIVPGSFLPMQLLHA